MLALIHGGDHDTLWRQTQKVTRVQLALFYAGAGLFKVNSSFMEPTTSCAPIFFALLGEGYLGGAWRHAMGAVSLAVAAAPTVTVVGELSIAVLWALGSAWGGVASALLLHLGIAVTPPPFNIGVRRSRRSPAPTQPPSPSPTPLFHHPSPLCPTRVAPLMRARQIFSCVCAVRLFAFVPEAVTRAACTAPSARALCAAAALILGAAVLGEAHFKDRALPCYVLFCLLYLRAALLAPDTRLEDDAAPAAALHDLRLGPPPPRERRVASAASRAVVLVFGVAGALISLVLPTLGLMDLGTPNMFANLRMHAALGLQPELRSPGRSAPHAFSPARWDRHGGSNHYLLPVGMLTHVVGGGIARVEDAAGSFGWELPGNCLAAPT